MIVIIIGVSYYYVSSKQISEREKQEILSIIGPKIERMLEGFNEDNYTKFSEFFSEDMKKSINITRFHDIRNQVITDVGLYVSYTSVDMSKADPYIRVIYTATFTKHESVYIIVAIDDSDPSYPIAGLWFSYT
jgi:hypothetical protein